MAIVTLNLAKALRLHLLPKRPLLLILNAYMSRPSSDPQPVKGFEADLP